jgi:hypothetical protein
MPTGKSWGNKSLISLPSYPTRSSRLAMRISGARFHHHPAGFAPILVRLRVEGLLWWLLGGARSCRQAWQLGAFPKDWTVE